MVVYRGVLNVSVQEYFYSIIQEMYTTTPWVETLIGILPLLVVARE